VAPPAAAGHLTLIVAGPQGSVEADVGPDDAPFRLELPLVLPPGPATLAVSTDRTWSPGGPDTRQLGVQLRRISVAPLDA